MLALPSALSPCRTRELDAVGGVEYGGVTVPGHDRERAHVDDEVLVAKGRSALGLPDLGAASVPKLGDHMEHFLRGQELALLDVDNAAGRRRREQQVGLAAEKGGDLQDVADGRNVVHLGHFVDIGQHGESVVAPHEGQQALVPRRFRGPWDPPPEVRLALSKDPLNTIRISGCARPIPARRSATARQTASLSREHGPAMRRSRDWSKILTAALLLASALLAIVAPMNAAKRGCAWLGFD